MLLPSPKDRRYLVLAQQLKGTGGRWGLGNLAAQPLSWEREKEMFLAHYVKRNETATARRKLWSIRQAPGEPFRVYGDRISELLRILDLPEQSDEVLLAFGEGLNNTLAVSYKAAEMVREPPTLMDAVALAAGLEDITSSQTEI